MASELGNLLTAYVGRMAGLKSAEEELSFAQSRGWMSASGELTPEGRKIAEAFREQQKTRSVFRIG
ncbi:MAG: hypothetical protein AAFW81_11490 [Pseudomonadota bacterium]